MNVETLSSLKQETKKRVRRMRAEFATKPDLKVFDNREGYNQIISLVGIEFSANCEHHKVRFGGDASIAYIAGEYLVGLSKLARVVEYFLNPTVYTLQERATQQIMNFLQEQLEPRGIMVVIRARHDCISQRGVKKNAVAVTSAVSGVFDTDLGARQEFLQIAHLNGKKI